MDTTSVTYYSANPVGEGLWARLWERHTIIAGALGGLIWGVLMRLWMRFISTDPEFSWSGTGFIVGAAVLVGLSLGTAYALKRRGRKGWWRVFGLPLILLGAGAGMIMLPGTVIGGLALGHRGWPKTVRISLIVLAIGGTIALIGLSSEDGFGPIKTAVAMVTFGLLHTIEMAAASIVFGSNRPD